MQWMALGNLWFLFIIPAILALYLLKRKYEDQEVPSTLLWQRTLQNWEVTRPWQRLRHNLLLLLQLLVALLLILALIRPATPMEGLVDAHTVLVVDTSGSMLVQEGEETRLSKAVQEARKVVENLGRGQTVTLLAADREPRILVSKSSDKAALLAALAELSPRPGTSDLRAALSLAGAIAATEPKSGIMWLGDGGGDRMTTVEAGIAHDLSFRFVQAGRIAENVRIGIFVTQEGPEGMQALLRIDNMGREQRTGKVSLYDRSGRLVDADQFAVEGSGSQTLTFSRLPKSEAYRSVISLERDGLQQDNELWSVPFTAGKARAVLVSPEGNRFVQQALTMSGRLDVETLQRLPVKTDGAADLWIFDRVVPEKLPEGNVMVIAPDRKTAWLPYEGMQELAEQPEAVDKADPLLNHVDWRDVHIAKHAVIGDMPGLVHRVRAGDADLIRSGTLEGRRVVIVGFDLHDSDFPLRPAFPIFMQNAVTWLSPNQSAPIGPAHPGDALAIPLTPGAEKRTLILPDGSRQEIQAEGTSWLFQVPEQIGLYELMETLGENKQSRYFSVFMNEAESQITPHRMSVSAGAAATGEAETRTEEKAGSREWTAWLAALALLVMLAEWRVYQRGY